MKKKLFFAALFLLVGPPLLWFFAVPDSLITGMIEREASKMGTEVKVEGFEKGLFFTFKADTISVLREGVELLGIDRLKGRINPLSLFLLKVDIPFEGTVSQGIIKGEIALKLTGRFVSASIENIDTAGVPVLAGVAHGTLSGDLRMKNGSGTMNFTLKEISRAPLAIKDANGLLAIAGGEITLKSVSMEGENINAKLKGSIINGAYRLTAEVMPRGSGTETELLKYSLARHEVSPGYYVIPLSGEIEGLP